MVSHIEQTVQKESEANMGARFINDISAVIFIA